MKIAQIKELMNVEPQLAEPESGAEPCLQEILTSYYAHAGFTCKECAKLVKDYVKAISEMVP